MSPSLSTYTRHRYYEWYEGRKEITMNKAVAAVWVDFGVLGLDLPSGTSHPPPTPAQLLPTLLAVGAALCQATAIALPCFVSNQVVDFNSDGFV